jgi:surfeit locus 1 family protein
MLFKNYQFRFSLFATILAIIGIIVFSLLGTWQSYRALEKQHMQDEMDEKQQQLGFLLNMETGDISTKKYLKVEAVGHYDKNNEILIDNTVHNGKAGYAVMTPFILKNLPSVIMINRGWVPVGRDRNILPEVETPREELRIHGIISPAKSKPPLILGELDTNARVWPYFDIEKYTDNIEHNLMPVIILLDKNDDHGYVREWPKYEAKVGMHIAYAIQWYVFALIVLVTYFGVHIKKREPNDSK